MKTLQINDKIIRVSDEKANELVNVKNSKAKYVPKSEWKKQRLNKIAKDLGKDLI